jgi:hypothetical protein
MAQLLDSDYNSNTYFFLTNFSDVLKAGKNSFIINPTQYVLPNTPLTVKVYDTQNNELPCGVIKPTNAKFSEQTNTGQLYYVNVLEDTPNGFGKIEVKGLGINTLDYTGSIAYYNNKAYRISKTQRLPLTSQPSSEPFETVDVLWSRNLLIDTTKKTDSEIRFFDSPYIRVRPEIYSAPLFPTGSYRLASGSFSSIAVNPKNNADGDYDYQFDDATYQLYWKTGTKFSSSMEGEHIRLKTPTVTKFTYTNFSDNRIEYQGQLNTDFIAKIKRVVNDTSILLDIPFSTVSELINRTNEDSPYAKNNLTEIKGYTVTDDASKQTVFHKKNFYVLSLSDGQFEIFHNDIPAELPRADCSNFAYFVSVLNVEFNNLRTLCGTLDYYKVYGRNLNSPESKTLLIESKIEPEQVIRSNKFDNGLRGNPSHFYNSSVLSKHWFVNGACTFYHTNEIFMNGAYIGHAGNSSLTDYVIYKDNTVAASQNSTYVAYSISPSSYWYANADAFVNYRPFPTASYQATGSIPLLNSYGMSQENLLSGVVHDSNSIKLRSNTLYKFGMRVKALAGNSNDAKLYVYYISGEDKKMIGYIDSSYNFGANELYENTFFSSQETFGTIILVPSLGNWSISSIILEPYQNVDYSIDSFAIKIPVKTTIPNQFYELDIELYDAQGRLAYGKNSYTSTYNKRFMPLNNNILIDPNGITTNLILDGGNANQPY